MGVLTIIAKTLSLVLDKTHKSYQYLSLDKKLTKKGFLEHFKGKNLKILSRALLTGDFYKYNKEWSYPCWINLQQNSLNYFSPLSYDPFLLNKSLRNWTVIGIENFDKKCIIDPCGSISIGKDSYSVSIALKSSDNNIITPNHSDISSFSYIPQENSIEIVYKNFGKQKTQTFFKKNIYFITSEFDFSNFLVSIRPFNPEGVAPIFSIELKKNIVIINDKKILEMPSIKKSYMSNYKNGDVLSLLKHKQINERKKIKCEYGFCTAAFEIDGNSFSIFPIKYKSILNAKKYLFNWNKSLAFDLNALELKKGYSIQRNYVLSFCTKKQIVSGAFTDNEFKMDDYTHLIPALDRLGEFEKSDTYIRNINTKKLESKNIGKYLWIILNHYLLSKNEEFLGYFKDRIYFLLERINKIRAQNYHFLLPKSKGKYDLSPIKKYIQDDLWSLDAYKLSFNIFNDDKLKRDYLSYFAVVKEEINDYCEKRKENLFFNDQIYDFANLVYPEILYDYNSEIIVNTIEKIKKDLLKQKIVYNHNVEGYDVLNTLKFMQVLLIKEDSYALTLLDRIFELSNSTQAFPESINPITLGGIFGDGHYSPISAEIINFINNIFSYDGEDNSIHIFKVSKKEWFDKSIEVTNLRTRYGKINYTIKNDSEEFLFSINGVNADVYLHLPFKVKLNEENESITQTIKISKGENSITFNKYED